MTMASARMIAASIVKIAQADHTKAVRQLAANPGYERALETKAEVECFFDSNWFDVLCELSPDLTKVHLEGNQP